MTALAPVRGRPRETALALVVGEAEPLVADFRRRFDAWSLERCIPPHVTLLYPFVDAERVDDELLYSVAELYRPERPFRFELASIRRFDGYAWLAPEPRDRLVRLIERTCARFPDCPPYGGAFAGSEPVPHLTIAAAGELDLDRLVTAAERELGPSLPLRCAARSVSLLEERPDGTWTLGGTFPLGGS